MADAGRGVHRSGLFLIRAMAAGMGPGVELLTAVMRHYQQITGRQLSADRIMAWHLRQALGDVLWRSEAGIPLADHRTPPQWVEDLAVRFSTLGIDPGAPHPATASPPRLRPAAPMSAGLFIRTNGGFSLPHSVPRGR